MREVIGRALAALYYCVPDTEDEEERAYLMRKRLEAIKALEAAMAQLDKEAK